MSKVNRALVLGDIGLQYAVEPSPTAPLLVVALPTEDEDGPRAVEYLRDTDMVTDRVWVRTRDGHPPRSLDLDEALPVWDGFALHPRFTELLTARGLLGEDHDLSSMSPLLVLRTHEQAGGPGQNEVLACTRLRTLGVLFAQVASFADEKESTDRTGDRARRGLNEVRRLHDHTGTDFQLYTTFESGTEIEMKFTLKDAVSPWGLAATLASRVGTDDFPGFIPDVGNEHQRWETRQETYEVLWPAPEVGYIAFIANASGSYLLKRKRFAKDGLRREETFRTEIEVPDGDFDAFLSKEYPELGFRRLPSLTRAKFDVNVESSRTGHFFGIEIDEVRVAERDAVLRQVELEYHRTRVHADMNPQLIEEELERLANLVEQFLSARGVPTERTFYSKLSFLRDIT
ncbi:hypothetical protein DKG34_39025 [Streptomyces sp. NWU49]|uniref:hypothetical protein n=1 Tax=Streptomyces sp. NWU49 TaxID=2201153 RepID=UPI000D682FEC|nr:hypothetical protein [Streptomyces sp. NWU49]PWJ02339.1 hypothetical protein DKG34_39025 [Streptomyces sp. NWU49]